MELLFMLGVEPDTWVFVPAMPEAEPWFWGVATPPLVLVAGL
jgi:hypothetical protein